LTNANTQSVPEPLTTFASILAVGFGVMLKKKTSKKFNHISVKNVNKDNAGDRIMLSQNSMRSLSDIILILRVKIG
jgi:hypothetical protein